ETIERMRSDIESAGCTISLASDERVVGTWDRLRLDQVVTNLIGNAIKYGPGKPVAVFVRATDAEARLAVRDHGIGIAPADRDRIFGRFERAVADTNYGGFGLGLWISRQAVEAMGGSITVDSALGEGSSFIVTLPLRRRPAEKTP